jgi:actin-related protein
MDRVRTSIAAERPPVVIEIGSLLTKIGISGEQIPKKIFYTPLVLRKWILTKDNPETVNKAFWKIQNLEREK